MRSALPDFETFSKSAKNNISLQKIQLWNSTLMYKLFLLFAIYCKEERNKQMYLLGSPNFSHRFICLFLFLFYFICFHATKMPFYVNICLKVYVIYFPPHLFKPTRSKSTYLSQPAKNLLRVYQEFAENLLRICYKKLLNSNLYDY